MTSRARTRSLPDISKLANLTVGSWHALGERLLQLGLTTETAASIAQVAGHLPTSMRGAIREWHLNCLNDRLGDAMRLLMFGGSVEYHRADLAVGQKLLKMLLGSGLLEQRNGEVRSPFYLNIVNDMLLICDDLSLGRGAVMGAGLTTMMLCEAAHPRRRLNSLLDLGCGAGTIALQFASHVDAATGSDVNPRAIQMANVNRMLNPMPNDCAVRFLVSDLFGELAEDKFDLIVAQPPFVPRFPEAAPATFLFGGHRGDELPLKLITQVPDHLGSAGRAVLLIEWPIVDDKPVEQLIRENPWSPRI